MSVSVSSSNGSRCRELQASRCLTGVCPVVVLHGRQVEEGVVAGRPGALKWFLPTVQFHVVVQGPFFTEGAIAQLAFKLPAGGEERRRGMRRRGRRKKKKEELFTDPKADIKRSKIYPVRKEMEVAGYSHSHPQSTGAV